MSEDNLHIWKSAPVSGNDKMRCRFERLIWDLPPIIDSKYIGGTDASTHFCDWKPQKWAWIGSGRGHLTSMQENYSPPSVELSPDRMVSFISNVCYTWVIGKNPTDKVKWRTSGRSLAITRRY